MRRDDDGMRVLDPSSSPRTGWRRSAGQLGESECLVPGLAQLLGMLGWVVQWKKRGRAGPPGDRRQGAQR